MQADADWLEAQHTGGRYELGDVVYSVSLDVSEELARRNAVRDAKASHVTGHLLRAIAFALLCALLWFDGKSFSSCSFAKISAIVFTLTYGLVILSAAFYGMRAVWFVFVGRISEIGSDARGWLRPLVSQYRMYPFWTVIFALGFLMFVFSLFFRFDVSDEDRGDAVRRTIHDRLTGSVRVVRVDTSCDDDEPA